MNARLREGLEPSNSMISIARPVYATTRWSRTKQTAVSCDFLWFVCETDVRADSVKWTPAWKCVEMWKYGIGKTDECPGLVLPLPWRPLVPAGEVTVEPCPPGCQKVAPWVPLLALSAHCSTVCCSCPLPIAPTPPPTSPLRILTSTLRIARAPIFHISTIPTTQERRSTPGKAVIPALVSTLQQVVVFCYEYCSVLFSASIARRFPLFSFRRGLQLLGSCPAFPPALRLFFWPSSPLRQSTTTRFLSPTIVPTSNSIHGTPRIQIPATYHTAQYNNSLYPRQTPIRPLLVPELSSSSLPGSSISLSPTRFPTSLRRLG